MLDIGKPTFPFLRVWSLLSGISLRLRLIGYSFKEVKRRERIICTVHKQDAVENF